MASTYSTSLKLELIGQGEQSGTWGLTTNNNLGTLVEQAITGVQTISMSNATYTLSSYDGAIDEARNAVLVMTGTNLAPQNLVAPAVEKVYIIKNLTGNTITIKTSSGTGIAISNSTVAQVYCDGTEFYNAAPTINNLTGNFTATGTITSGGAMTSGGTLTAPTLSIAGTGSTGSNFSVGGNTYTYGLTNYGSQTVAGNETVSGTQTVTGRISTSADIVSTGSTNYGSSQVNGNQVVNGTSSSGASTVNGNQTVTGTASSGAIVTSSIYNYGSGTINGNLTVGGTLSASAVTGVTGIIKAPIIVQTSYTAVTTSSYSPVPTGHVAQITPSSASSKILVLWYGLVRQPDYLFSSAGENYMQVAMYRNGSANSGTVGINVTVQDQQLRIGENGLSLAYVDSPGTTATVTYQMYYWKDGAGAAQTTYNPFGGATITLLEITQ
jgi:hypothetical protein